MNYVIFYDFEFYFVVNFYENECQLAMNSRQFLQTKFEVEIGKFHSHNNVFNNIAVHERITTVFFFCIHSPFFVYILT